MSLFGALKHLAGEALTIATTPVTAVLAVTGMATGALVTTAVQGAEWLWPWGNHKFNALTVVKVAAVAGLLGTLGNSFVANHVVRPPIELAANELTDSSAPTGDQQIPAVCGPVQTGPDGKQYQEIAVPLPAGVKPTGRTVTDHQTNTVYQVGLVPAGLCTNDVLTIPSQSAGINGALGSASGN